MGRNHASMVLLERSDAAFEIGPSEFCTGNDRVDFRVLVNPLGPSITQHTSPLNLISPWKMCTASSEAWVADPSAPSAAATAPSSPPARPASRTRTRWCPRRARRSPGRCPPAPAARPISALSPAAAAAARSSRGSARRPASGRRPRPGSPSTPCCWPPTGSASCGQLCGDAFRFDSRNESVVQQDYTGETPFQRTRKSEQ